MRFFLASFLLALALPCLIAAVVLYGRRFTRWSRTMGDITAVSIRSSKHLTVQGHMFYHQILVTVRYQQANQPHQRRINPHTTDNNLPLAESLANSKYQAGNKLAIFYSKVDPREITLQPDEDWAGYPPRLLTAGLALTAIGVLLAL